MKNSSETVKKILFYFFQTLASTCLLLLLLEGVFFVRGFPQGASDFIERVILQQKLELRKPPGQYRIFVYGESTVHGAGYAPVSSPVKWLDAYLKDFLPGRDVKVVNFGRLGEESDFIAQSFLDTLQYKPDLAIFYLGHNTFYPDNRVDFVKKKNGLIRLTLASPTGGKLISAIPPDMVPTGVKRISLKKNSEFTNRLRKWFHKSRLISAVVREAIKHKIKRYAGKIEDVMGDTTIENLPPTNGQGYRSVTLPGGHVFLENVLFFQDNIEKILMTGKKNHVPLLFMKPVCNLKDYPPDFSRHLKALTAEELAQWDRLYRSGHEAVRKKDSRMAIEFFEKAFAIDPSYADLCFELGQLYFQKGELEKARFFFEQARDDDVVIRRAPKAILNVFNDLAKREPLYFFDTEKALVSKTPGGILGWPLIEDNVHFSLEGHALIGRALADEIAQHNWIAPRSEWQFDHERPMAEIEKELGITRRTVFLNYCAVVGYLGHRYDERLEFARRARDIFPEDPIALRLLAWAHWLLGERKQALDIYKQLGKKNPVALEIVFRAQPDIRRAYEASAAAPASSERQQKQL